MFTKSQVSLLIIFFIVFQPIFGLSITPDDPEKKERPKVGLVLSGGGAKGFAYGMLRVFQEVGLRVDYVGGTSIGSIIGGLYAIGYSPDEIERMVRAQDWDALLKDKILRKYIAFDEREFMENSIIALPLKKRKVGLKQAMFEGQQINLVLNKYFSPAWDKTNFNDLQTPFLCVGANLFNGDAEILREGYLPMAIRSSMSIPGYFTPTYYNGKYLVDGGIVDNYPALPVEEMGAQLLVGCDLQSGLADTITDLSSLTEIISQIIFFHGVEANEKTKEVLDLDFHLEVQAGMLDFNEFDKTIAYGEQQARLHYKELKQLADSLNAIEYLPLKEYNTVPLDSIEIAEVVYEGNKHISRKYLDNYFGHFRNTKIALDELELVITKVYGSQFFKHVFYELQPNDEGRANLIIQLEESSPGYIGAAIHYDLDYNGSIRLNGIFRNVLGGRSKLLAEIIMGSSPRFRMLYTISNGAKPSFGVEIDLFKFHFHTYDLETLKKRDAWAFTQFKPSVFVTSTIANVYNFRMGFEYDYFMAKQEIIGFDDMDLSGSDRFGNIFARFKADTRNKLYYATKGFNTELKARYVLEPFTKKWWGDMSTDALIVYLKYEHYSKLTNKLTVNPGLFVGGMRENDDPSPQYMFASGGLNDVNYVNTYVPFTGYKFIQEFGSYAAIARLKLQYNVYKELYLIARSDFGDVVWYIDDFNFNDAMFGYGLTAAYNSFIGPIEFTIMGAENDPSLSYFVNVGFSF